VFIARLWRVPAHRIAGILSPWPLFGLICARIGNFWNSEMTGTPSSFPFAIGFYFSGDHGAVPRHPVQLYEAVLTLLLLCIMLVVFLKKRATHRPYLLPALAVTGYSAIRFLSDFVKDDPGHLFGPWLSTGQWLSLIFGIGGILLLKAGGTPRD
ncbi:MAG: prolipoprotein diacylglyceryl transferase, partial [Deltaproteobacteria bacterium]|nr:prolipoprotein diacylglyceryl transferase [Deltaproteobacteria bacterium]